MKSISLVGWSSALCLSMGMLQAQETNEVEQLRKQLQQAMEAFQKAADEHRRTVDELNRRLEALEQKQGRAASATNAPPAPPTSPAVADKPAWSPAQPITLVKSGQSYMNISFDAVMNVGWSTAPDVTKELNLGDHDPTERGFSLRNAEIAVDGAVDPYFKGFANIVLKLDNQGETDLELEETYLQSSSLPANLQLKAGQFFAAFGRQNPQHPHQWAFVDQPLMLSRVFGPEGLRNIGAQVSWLVPTPFYTEAVLGVFNGQGETAFSFRNPGHADDAGIDRVHGRATSTRDLRGLGDLLYVPRLASSFDLTPEQTVVGGVSAAFGPNETGPHRRTEIYGLDLYWKWKPAAAHAGYPFVAWQTEGFYQRFGAAADAAAGLPSESLRDYGLYSQVLWGFHERWVAGLRGEFVTGNRGAADAQDVFRGERTRVSPNLTFYPSEFSKFRLQYNYDHGDRFGVEHSVWLQAEFLLGAHGAHKF